MTPSSQRQPVYLADMESSKLRLGMLLDKRDMVDIGRTGMVSSWGQAQFQLSPGWYSGSIRMSTTSGFTITRVYITPSAACTLDCRHEAFLLVNGIGDKRGHFSGSANALSLFMSPTINSEQKQVVAAPGQMPHFSWKQHSRHNSISNFSLPKKDRHEAKWTISLVNSMSEHADASIMNVSDPSHLISAGRYQKGRLWLCNTVTLSHKYQCLN